MKAIPTDKNISDVNIMCLLYHVYRVKYIVHYKWFDGDPRPMAFFHNCYLRHVGWERLAKIFFHLRLPVRPCGFCAPLWGFKILRQELPDSHIFVRHFVPSKMVHWGSQVNLLVCKLTK